MGKYKPQILVVDDDHLILTILSDILSLEFRVLTAADGEAGIEILKREPVSALLCDQTMPKVLGVEVLGKCAELQPKAVRILITASDNVADIANAVNQARVHRVVVKPVREVEIVATIKSAIREVELEEENRRLVKDLRNAVEALKEREAELGRELNLRTKELREVVARFKAEGAGGSSS